MYFIDFKRIKLLGKWRGKLNSIYSTTIKNIFLKVKSFSYSLVKDELVANMLDV